MASLGSRTLAIATRSAATPSGARDLSTSSCTTPLHFSARRSTPTPKLGPPSPANSLASTTSRTTQQSGPDEPSDFLAASSPQSEKQRRHRRRGQDDQPPPCADQPNARDADHPNGRSNTASRPIRHVSKPAIVQSPDRPTATKEQEVRSPRNSATTPASRQVPLSASATTTGPTARALPERVVGATSIALATSLVIQNAVLVWVGAPSYGDPIKEVLAFHAENRGAVAVAVAVGSEALTIFKGGCYRNGPYSSPVLARKPASSAGRYCIRLSRVFTSAVSSAMVCLVRLARDRFRCAHTGSTGLSSWA